MDAIISPAGLTDLNLGHNQICIIKLQILHSVNVLFLIGEFNPLMASVITDKEGLRLCSFLFSMCHFFDNISPLLPSFLLIRYVLLYYFYSFLISFTKIYFDYFLNDFPGDYN